MGVTAYRRGQGRQPISDVHDVVVRGAPQILGDMALRPDESRYLPHDKKKTEGRTKK